MKDKSSDMPADMRARLDAVADLPDDQIDLSDAPEQLDWTGAIRGMFYKPVKQLKSLRVDADVVAYFKSGGPGYQTRINRVLRASMLRDLRRRAVKQG